MSKFAKIALLTLAAFLFLGFSITATAGNPWLAGKEQQIVSAPLPGGGADSGFTCQATNLSDSKIEIHVVITNDVGFAEADKDVDVDAGLTETVRAGGPKTSRCTINWKGNRNDFVGSFCAYENQGTVEGIVCLELF